MSEKKTIGFGAPNEMDPHHFTVEIPAARTEPVIITEHFGLRGGSNGLPDSIVRCRLPRVAWSGIAEEAKRVLNERLKEKEADLEPLVERNEQGGASARAGIVRARMGRRVVREGFSFPMPSAIGSRCAPTSAGGCSPWPRR